MSETAQDKDQFLGRFVASLKTSRDKWKHASGSGLLFAHFNAILVLYAGIDLGQ